MLSKFRLSVVCRLSVTLVRPTQPVEIFGNFLANVLRYVRYMLSAVHLLSVCRLSVCDVGAPYSGG